MNPIVDFLWTMRHYGPDARYTGRIALYLFKALFFEPFRLGERVVATLKSEPRPLPKAPLFILGYYRSGTTHLQETLLEDPQFGYMNFFQCFFPGAFTTTELWAKPICEAFVKRVGMLHPAHQIPFSFKLPAEEDVSMVASGFRLAANWGQTYPRNFKEIYTKTGLLQGISAEDRKALADHLADLFWRVSKSNDHKRLLLKSPPQLGRVSLLTEMFPDAKYIFIRRNPYDVFASNKKLWKSFGKTQLQDLDPETEKATVREYILWSYEECHRAYERDRKKIAPGHLCEISYEEFRADPMAILRTVYETLGLGDFKAMAPVFTDYLARTHQGSQPPYAFTEVERHAVATRLAPWIEGWGYAAPPALAQAL
jgi:omega-hydroxy-beta-dihydromenaquinone-9 sulfotransferase